MTKSMQTWLLRIVIAAVIAGSGYLAWQALRPKALPEGFASGNGRIEATEIDVATKIAGRVEDIKVHEGDFVKAGQVLAVMDIEVLEAQLREAEADLKRAQIGVETAHSQVSQREAEKKAAEASVAQRQAELDAAQKRLARSEELVPKGATSVQVLDDNRATYEGAKAAVAAAEAQVAAAEAAIGLAKSQVIGAQSSVEATRATIQRIKADIDDSTLRAPRDGRVQYRVAEPGEVLAAGGTVLNLVDLSDVYMTLFLPTKDAGRVKLGADAHIVLDAAPQYVIPAKVSFVADVAQFTPKTVETAEERLKLMFRIKTRIAPELLKKHIRDVKTGLPGVAYVQLDPQAPWPPDLQVHLPE
jgi:HlyD family secretion protein